MMKKFTTFLFSLFLVVVFASPAMAVSSDYNESLVKRDDLIVNAIKNGETDIEKVITENFTMGELNVPKVEKVETKS